MKQSKTPAGGTPKPLQATNSAETAPAWPHSDMLHSLNLEGVIGHLEQTHIEQHPVPEQAKKLLAAVKLIATKSGVGHEPTNRDHFKDFIQEIPDKPMPAEKLIDLLPVIWADYRLWRALRMKPPESAHLKDALAAYFLLKFYNLQIPFRDSVWLELPAAPTKWNFLEFLMMVNRPSRFFYVQAPSAKDELTEGERLLLHETLLGKLLTRYAQFPLEDWRPLLGQMKLPLPVLRRLAQAAGSLAKDASWCVKNHGSYVARRAPTAGHRIRGLHDVKLIEQMVVLLSGDPGISDYALAKQGMGRMTAAGRKLAKEAKLLAFYRDAVPVKFHKSRGDKNAPTSPA